MTQTFLLPFPPTANHMWKHASRKGAGQHYLSAKYRAWKDAAGKQLLVQRAKSIKGPVRVLIGLCSPTNHAWDLDNRIKPVLDLLVSHLVIEEDNTSIVRGIDITASDQIGARVTVIPLEAV